jgi:hypothetical protein
VLSLSYLSLYDSLSLNNQNQSLRSNTISMVDYSRRWWRRKGQRRSPLTPSEYDLLESTCNRSPLTPFFFVLERYFACEGFFFCCWLRSPMEEEEVAGVEKGEGKVSEGRRIP